YFLDIFYCALHFCFIDICTKYDCSFFCKNFSCGLPYTGSRSGDDGNILILSSHCTTPLVYNNFCFSCTTIKEIQTSVQCFLEKIYRIEWEVCQFTKNSSKYKSRNKSLLLRKRVGLFLSYSTQSSLKRSSLGFS